METSNPIVLYFFGISALTFLFFGCDKLLAKQGFRRIPEKTLLTLAFLGGWPAGYAGQVTFRHKTKKQSFQRLFWLVAVCNTIVCALIYTALMQ